VPAEELEKEKEIYKDQARASGKPENIIDKIAEGKLGAYYQIVCLYDQMFVKDPSLTVEQLINALIGKIGENIRVRRFVRYQTGEGLEKRSTDLKSEVEGMLGQ
jgi:elongation factor Ts